MGLDVLEEWLAVAGVPPGTVVVGDAPGEGVWRIHAVGGAGEDAWEVFWAQDGRRHAWVRFDDEATACFALFGRLVWARLVVATPPG